MVEHRNPQRTLRVDRPITTKTASDQSGCLIWGWEYSSKTQTEPDVARTSRISMNKKKDHLTK